MIPSLKDLRLVETDCLILHEAHDETRLARLRDRIESEDEQRNPVVASPHEDRFLVLDGAHRVRALRELGYPFVLVQRVEPPEQAEGWAHLIEDLSLPESGEADGIESSGEPSADAFAEVDTRDGTVFLRSREAGPVARARALWEIQSRYPEGDTIRRVEPDGPVRLSGREALIRYRPFAPEELVEIVGSGAVLPAGVTRFRVQERVLGVRYPLDRMRHGNTRTRNVELRKFIAERWEANRVRLYREPVVLFE